VESHEKISDTEGGFAGTLDDSDFFATAVTALGDLNGDAVSDLAVGAFGTNDGGTDRGAVWVLFLGDCVVDPTYIDFGSVVIGNSADTIFTIANSGFEIISGNVEEPCGDYEILTGGGPYVLGPGESHLVSVRFAPTTVGASACTVSTDAQCSDVALAGTGQANPAPQIMTIADVGNDEGRRVRITFAKSSNDVAGSSEPIIQYEAFRRIDPLPSLVYGDAMDLEARTRDARAAGMISEPALLAIGWDYAGAVPAHLEPEYNMLAGTLADSTHTNGMYWSAFFIRAATDEPGVFFDSAVDSGYSLDNLSPPPVSGFVAVYDADEGNELSWEPSAARDFATFRIYRDATPTFTPRATNLAHLTRVTRWLDATGQGGYYQITAADSSGNESDPLPPAIIGTPELAPRTFALHQNVPNPFNPSTLIRYDVAAPGGRVTIAIYDVRGALVRTLVDRNEAPGSKTEPWDGKDHRGREVTSGVYFYRMQTEGFSETRKMVLMR
jgi:hypothetical protein